MKAPARSARGGLAVGLVRRGHRFLRGRIAAHHLVTAEERLPVLLGGPELSPDERVAVGDHLADEQPAFVAVPAPAPVRLTPVERHEPGAYDLEARCRSCSTVLAPGPAAGARHSDLCVLCRAFPEDTA